MSWLDAVRESVGEFGNEVANQGNDALLKYSERQINKALGNEPTKSTVSSPTPEKATDQLIQPDTTQAGNAARQAALMDTLRDKKPQLLMAAGALLVLLIVLRRS